MERGQEVPTATFERIPWSCLQHFALHPLGQHIVTCPHQAAQGAGGYLLAGWQCFWLNVVVVLQKNKERMDTGMQLAVSEFFFLISNGC